MSRRIASLTAMFLIAAGVTAFAADETTPAKPLQSAVARAAKSTEPALDVWATSQGPRRPAALTALYGSYAVMQALDVLSTRRAVVAGAQEGNPLMHGGAVAPMIAVKAATGASTIYFAERMWKKNKAGAIVVMTVLNGASAAIVAHNQRNAHH